jgi:small subunit ribosomal protein S8
MSLSDPIADMLTRIRNGAKAGHPQVRMPASRLKQAVAEVLVQQGYLGGAEMEGDGTTRELCLTLKYHDKKPVIKRVKRISHCSCRVYTGAKEIPRVMGGMGIVVLSTPQGVMTGKEARKLNVGGEILCEVY